MPDSPHLPLTDPKEIEALADDLPMAVDRNHFQQFVLGFPRRYLQKTSQMEIVRHYLMMDALGDKMVISSLYAQDGLWKLSLFTRDRTHLFALIAGTLNHFGMDIVHAESFVNARAFVLEGFSFQDAHDHLAETGHSQKLLHFLEDVLEGKRDLESLLKRRWDRMEEEIQTQVLVEFDDECHPLNTLLRLTCEDRFGFLYLASCCISDEGHNIETAYVETADRQVRDEFYLTHQGSKLTAQQQRRLAQTLVQLGNWSFGVGSSFVSPHSDTSPAPAEPTVETSG